MEESITRQCQNCHKDFQIKPKDIRTREKKGYKRAGHFCSPQCSGKFNRKRIPLTCSNCGAPFERRPVEATGNGRNKSNHNFCSRSCAATYNNTHKTYGTRRSKLESYLEQQLRSEFPDIELICNSKDAIGSELDFYFPQLRLAIELNGIFHYEPIYGTNKLEQIQRNDQQKYANCLAVSIELCIIDSSSVKHVTANVKERYWSIIKDLVTPLLGRANEANVQAP